jgi:2'-5' RNA ligase
MSDLFGAAPEPTDRLLFLIYPDPETAARIADQAVRLRGANALRGRPVRTDRLHITLNHLGDHAGLPEDMVRLAREAAASIGTAPFEVTFDRAGSFGGKPRGNLPFVLRGGEGVADLIAFQQALAVAMIKTGSRIGKWAERAYTPHVTLLYDDQSAPEQAIAPIRWTVAGFALVHSLKGQTIHKVLDQWSLAR